MIVALKRGSCFLANRYRGRLGIRPAPARANNVDAPFPSHPRAPEQV